MARAPRIAIDVEANVAGLISDMRAASQAVTRFTETTKKEIKQASSSMEAMQRQLRGVTDLIKISFAGFATGNVLTDLARLADRYSNLDAKLKVATRTVQDYNTAYKEVQRIAHETSTPIEQTVTLYQRLEQSLRQMGVPQRDVLDVTETVNKAFIVSGATSQEASAAIIQLSQAFAAGALRGEEFNSVNEQAPRLMQAIADSLKVPRGALKELAAEGKLTSKVLLDALSGEQAQRIAEEFTTVPLTIERAFQRLKNSILIYVGEANKASQTSQSVASMISSLAENFNKVADAALTLGAVIATVYVGRGISALTQWVETQYKALAASVAARNAAAEEAAAAAAANAAKLRDAQATLAVVEAARAEATARLTAANAAHAQAAAAIAAARANMQGSFAIKVIREAEEQLASAQLARAAAVNELAVLGQQQARLNTVIASSTANVGKEAANAAGKMGLLRSAAAGVGSSLMAMAGGPVGVAVLAIGAMGVAFYQASERAREFRQGVKDAMQAMRNYNSLQSDANKVEAQRQMDLRREQLIGTVKALEDRIRYLARGGGNEAAGLQIVHLQDQLDKAKQKLAEFDKLYRETASKMAANAGRTMEEAARTFQDPATAMVKDFERLRRSMLQSVDPLKAAREELDERIKQLEGMRGKGGLTDSQIDDAIHLAWDDYEKTVASIEKAQDRAGAAARRRAEQEVQAVNDIIEAAKGRNEMLTLELKTGENVGQARKDLIKFELMLENTKNMTLRAQANSIRKMLEENVALEQQIEQRKRLLEAQQRELMLKRQIEDFNQSRQREYQREIEAIRHGGRTAELNSRLNSVADEFRGVRRGIDDDFRQRLNAIPMDDHKARNELQAEYNKLIEQTIIAEQQAINVERDMFAKRLQAQRDWTNGARAAMEDYKARAEDVAGQTRELFTRAFQRIEDAIVQFAMTGKLNFKDFVNSVVEDFIRMETRILLSKVFEWLTNWVISAFTAAPASSGSTSSGSTSSGSSGFVGPRAKGAAYVGNVEHYAAGGTFTNQIVSKPTMFSFANGSKFGEMGEAGPEAIVPLARDSKGRLGVHAVGAADGGGQVININTTVVLGDGGGTSKSSDSVSSDLVKKLGDMVEGKVKEVVVRESQQGGIIWKLNYA